MKSQIHFVGMIKGFGGLAFAVMLCIYFCPWLMSLSYKSTSQSRSWYTPFTRHLKVNKSRVHLCTRNIQVLYRNFCFAPDLEDERVQYSLIQLQKVLDMKQNHRGLWKFYVWRVDIQRRFFFTQSCVTLLERDIYSTSIEIRIISYEDKPFFPCRKENAFSLSENMLIKLDTLMMKHSKEVSFTMLFSNELRGSDIYYMPT